MEESSSPKRVVLFGPESTGKTTLAKKLAQTLDGVAVPEFLREYLNIKLYHADLHTDVLVSVDELDAIGMGQMIMEDIVYNQALVDGKKIVFFDTNLIMNQLYNSYYHGRSLSWLSKEIDKRTYDLYLLLDTSCPFYDDEQRDNEIARDELFQIFHAELLRKKLPHAIISGADFDERYMQALRKIKDFFSSLPFS